MRIAVSVQYFSVMYIGESPCTTLYFVLSGSITMASALKGVGELHVFLIYR